MKFERNVGKILFLSVFAYRLSVNIFNLHRFHDFDHSLGRWLKYNEVGNTLRFATSIHCTHHIFASVFSVG